MKVLMLKDAGVLEIASSSKPEIGKDEVLIAVKATGICGSDIKGFLGKNERITPPIIMGHESTGYIEKIGENVKDFFIKDRVVVQPLLFCGACKQCKKGKTNQCSEKKILGAMQTNGSLAEFIALPSKQVFILPDKLDYVKGTLIEPLSVAHAAVKKVDVDKKTILVIGAGAIGLLILRVLKTKNPFRVIITDIEDNRLRLAKTLGSDLTVNTSKEDLSKMIKDFTENEGIDTCFEAVGTKETAKQSIEILNNGGTCVWVGNTEKEVIINMQDLVTREINIIGSYVYSHKEFEETIEFIENNNIDLGFFISDVMPLEKGADAFRNHSIGSNRPIKTVLTN